MDGKKLRDVRKDNIGAKLKERDLIRPLRGHLPQRERLLDTASSQDSRFDRIGFFRCYTILRDSKGTEMPALQS